jgi:hypothetical protein
MKILLDTHIFLWFIHRLVALPTKTKIALGSWIISKNLGLCYDVAFTYLKLKPLGLR